MGVKDLTPIFYFNVNLTNIKMIDMKKIKIIVAFLTLTYNCYPQDYLPFDKIEQLVSDSSKTTFYPKLINRFNNFDSTLTINDYILIYYGFGFQENYNGYRDEPTTMYYSLFEKKEYNEILKKCDSVLNIAPVCIASNTYKGKVLKILSPNNMDYKRYFDRSFKLMDVLFNSGDGKSMNTAYKILFLSDEKRIMYGELNLGRYSEQALINHYDKLTVKKSKKFNKKNIYFDVFLPLSGLKKMMDEK